MNTYRTFFIVAATTLSLSACGKSNTPTKAAASTATAASASAKAAPAEKAAAGKKTEKKAEAGTPAAVKAAAKVEAKPKAAPMPGQIPAPTDVAAIPADAAKTPSGLASKVLTKGTAAAHPSAKDIVKVHYTGWTTDGKMFDSSVTRGEPIEFPLNRVIAGWTEGVQLMVVGEKRRLWIPEKLAYQGRRGAPAGMLVFDVELIEIKAAPKAPSVPKDVAAPPADAEKTKSGLVSKIIKKGTGDKHPTAASMVSVHYSGWTTDGKMFDSSVTRGKPASFPLSGVIAGWTEGVQLMVEGETRRFWIPEGLAYKGRPGAPAGMLVFDVELLKIMK